MRTYGAIERLPTKDGWVIPELEPHVALRLKQIFPVIGKTSRVPFTLKGGPQLDADLEWFMIRYPLKISDEDRAAMREGRLFFEQQQAEINAILLPEWKPKDNYGFREGKAPFDYQARAAEIARRMGRLLVMDSVGLGKTVTAFAAICDPQYLPAVIVPQTHLVSQWEEKLREFTNLRVHIIKKTTPYDLPPADVYICPYSKLGGWVDYADRLGLRSIVFDEMQELRHGTTTKKGKAAWNFAQFAQLKIGLTATPIYGYGSEMWHVLQFLDEGALGSWDDFTREWCTCHNGHWIVDDPEALGTYLRERLLVVRRDDVDVGRPQVPVNIITHEIPFDAEVLATDEMMMRHLAKQVLEGSFTERGQASREFDMLLRRITGLAKAPHVAAYVRLLLEAGRPVLLGGWHRDVYEVWNRWLKDYNPVMYTGTESPRKKDLSKRLFIEGKSHVMILSLRSGAGLDGLQERCSTIVFGELDWSPEVHTQFIGRLRRPGQTADQVDAIYLTADGGSDPVVSSVLGLKASQAHGIIDPTKRAGKQHSDLSRIKELARLYLEGRLGQVRKVTPAAPANPVELEPVQQSLF